MKSSVSKVLNSITQRRNKNMIKNTNKNLNLIAPPPPPPPPIISHYTIEETLIKALSLRHAFLAKFPKLASFWRPLRHLCPKDGVFCTLSILLLTATLSLTHCKNDDNGGGGSSSKEPEPEPIYPIYLWITGCTVLGDMSGDGMDGSCDNMTAYADGGADDICESRYAEDVASEHRTTIMEQHETGTLGHKALLASSGGDSNLPQNFDINGKDSQPIRRPDGTQIAASWATFFNGEQDIDNSVSGTDDRYWIGLRWDSVTSIFSVEFADSSIATIACDAWSTASPGSSGSLNFGLSGQGDQKGRERIVAMGDAYCESSDSVTRESVDRYLLCITH